MTSPRTPETWDPRACSVLGDDLDEPAYGTAPYARAWVALEQPGPWGRDAAAQSHLDAGLGRELASRCSAAGGRFVLVRATGPHADDHHDRPRTVLVSSCAPENPWLLTGTLHDVSQLRDLDVDAVVRGDLAATSASMPGLERTAQPVFLVCTNGRRDVCCAVRGRPVAHDAAAARPGQVWETSHTGGHRFAPTGVVLPSGLTLARVGADDVVSTLDAAARGEMPAHLTGPRHDRGCSALPPVEQVATSAIRHLTGLVRMSALEVEAVTESAEDPAESTRVVVRVTDPARAAATRVTVGVTRTTREPRRPVSCHKPDEPQEIYDPQMLDLRSHG